jgi:hypothetical protein
VNWSAELVLLVPPAVVTVTSTVPVPAGETAVIDVVEFTVKLVAPVEPNFTAVAPVKLVPPIVTDVPPVSKPVVGLRFVTVGSDTKLNRSAGLIGLVPPGVVTVTSTVPVPAGETAVTEVSESTVKLAALAAPK